jgi:hypothetical protein
MQGMAAWGAGSEATGSPLWLSPGLRLCAPRSDSLGFQPITDGSGESFGLVSRMWSETSSMQPLLRRRRDQVLVWECEPILERLCVLRENTTPDPEQPSKIDARGRCGFWMKGIAYIDPGAHAFCTSDLSQK